MHPLLSKAEKPAVNVDEYAQQLVYWNDVYDCHQGECFGAIYGSYKQASPSAPVAAKLTYSTYENEIHVKMIEVHPQIRRRGVGTKLYNRLKQEYPDMKINWGMSTPDGTEWLKSVQGSNQIKVLYHGTSRANVEAILRDGLMVKYSEDHIEWDKAIYLACDKWTAKNYAGMHGLNAADWVVLEIDVKQLREDLFRPDDYDFPNLWSEVPEDVRQEHGDNWALAPWTLSLEISCQAAYLGNIPASAIKITDEKTSSVIKIAWQEITLGDDNGNLIGGLLEDDQDLTAWAEHEDIPELRIRQRKKFTNTFKGKRVAVIDDMRVFNRGKGYGTKLMKEFEAKARASNCDAIILQAGIYETQEEGFDLVQWYERQGFKTIGRSANLPLMVKWLKAPGKKAYTPAQMYFGEGVESSKIAGKKPSKNATVQINIPHELAWKMQQAAKAAISESDLAGDGFEIHPHITVKYGVEEDEDKLLEALDGQEPFEITLGKTHVFEPSGASDATAPVVIEIKSDELKTLHEAVGRAIGNRKDDFEYKAHATLAYVKPEASKKYDGLDFLEGVSFTAEEITLSKKSRAQITIPFGEAPATKTANADATHSLTMTADVEGFPPMVLVRWPQKGVRWRTVLKVVKQIAAEVAGKRVPWRNINIFQSPWKSKQEQDEAWGRATGRPMYDIMEDGSYVAVGQNPPTKMGSHKITPFGDTEYQNPEIGEENNGYAMEPDQVKGADMMPTLEELAPDLFKTGAIDRIPTIEELLQDRGMSLGEAQGDWDKIRAECAERVKAEGGDWEKLTDAQKEVWEEKVGWEWLRGNWAEAEDKLRALQFPLTVYRGIAGKTLRDIYHGLPGDKDWYGQPKGFGVYWSWNEHNAYVHEELAANAEDIIVFRGVIRQSNFIDWMATSWSHLVAPDEFEIDLYPGSQIEITGWKKRGETQWRTPPKNFRTITAAYAEAQNKTQHYQPPTGLYKVLKSDPFAEEWDLFGPKEAAALVPDQIDNPDKEFSGAFEFAKSLGWQGMNPWYPEKYPWLALRVYSDGWRITNDMAKVTMAEGTTLGELKKFLSKYDLKKLRSEPVGTTLRAQPVPKKLNATLKSIQAARVPLRPQPKFIYHVSEVSNEESIKTHGINPELSQHRWNLGDNGFYAFTEYMDAVKYIGDVASHTDAGINFQIWRVKPTTTVVTDDSFFVDELPAAQWQDDSGEADHSAVFHPGAVPAANVVLVALFNPDNNQFLFEDRSKIAAVKSETKTMYHVTPQDNLESISKTGLQPVDGKLYLASILPDSGVGSVEAEAENEQVWLEVQVPAGLELHPDPEFPGEAHSFYTTQPIPAKNIAVVQPQTRQRVPLEKLAASAKPIHENVEGAPFKIGMPVRYVRVLDEEEAQELGADKFLGQTGTLEYYEYSCGCGQHYPDDPMIGVRFSNGDLHEFWGEELEPATGEKQAKGQTIGQAYLLHFDVPGGQVVEPSREDADKPFHARHYLGWGEDAQERINQHYKAQSGVKIIDAIHQKNITFSVARIWDQVDRNFERRLKDQGGLSRHCPICKQQGLIPASRYRGKALQDIQVAPATANAGPDFIELEN